MLDDRARKKLHHPSRQILRRAINGQLPDDDELRALGMPDELTAQVLEAAEIIAQTGKGSMRGRARARLLAEQLSDSIAEATPHNSPHGLTPADDNDDDPADLAARIEQRMREGEAETVGLDDLDAERAAVRELRRGRRGA